MQVWYSLKCLTNETIHGTWNKIEDKHHNYVYRHLCRVGETTTHQYLLEFGNHHVNLFKTLSHLKIWHPKHIGTGISFPPRVDFHSDFGIFRGLSRRFQHVQKSLVSQSNMHTIWKWNFVSPKSWKSSGIGVNSRSTLHSYFPCLPVANSHLKAWSFQLNLLSDGFGVRGLSREPKTRLIQQKNLGVMHQHDLLRFPFRHLHSPQRAAGSGANVGTSWAVSKIGWARLGRKSDFQGVIWVHVNAISKGCYLNVGYNRKSKMKKKQLKTCW